MALGLQKIGRPPLPTWTEYTIPGTSAVSLHSDVESEVPVKFHGTPERSSTENRNSPVWLPHIIVDVACAGLPRNTLKTDTSPRSATSWARAVAAHGAPFSWHEHMMHAQTPTTLRHNRTLDFADF